jgi:hypothetical protein
MPNCIVLRDSGCLIEGVSFYGMSASATKRPGAFGRSVSELKTIWSNVPDGVDVLISHSHSRDRLQANQPAGGAVGFSGGIAGFERRKWQAVRHVLTSADSNK